MRIGYLECFSGISGDMLLGALVDAGVPFAFLEETAAQLNVGAHLEFRKVTRGGIAATKVEVITPDHPAPAPDHDHSHSEAGHSHEEHSHATHTHAPHRHLSSILDIIRAELQLLLNGVKADLWARLC